MAPDFSSVAPQTAASALDNVKELVVALRSMRGEIEAQTARLEHLNDQFNQLVLITIPEAMQQANMSEFKTLDGAVLKVKDDINAHINIVNQPVAYGWLREHGLGSIIKEDCIIDVRALGEDVLEDFAGYLGSKGIEHTSKQSIHAATLKSTVKELLAKGATLPAEISVHQFKKAELKEPKK